MKTSVLIISWFTLGFIIAICFGCVPQADTHIGEISKIEVVTFWDLTCEDLDGYHVTFKDGYEVYVQPYTFQYEEDTLIANKKYVGKYGRFLDSKYGIIWSSMSKPKPKIYHSWE